MYFDKQKFIKENNQFSYASLRDFLESEINEFTYNVITCVLLCENVRSFSYEGNQYVIEKKRGSSRIVIVDDVSREHGVPESQCKFEIEMLALLELINNSMLIRIDNFQTKPE